MKAAKTKTTTKIAEKNHAKRLERKKQSAEDFTPKELVNQMIDKLLKYSPDIISDPQKTFIDPAAGNGNILIEILKRRLQHMSPIQAVSALFGCDIMIDNIKECHLRLFKVVTKYKKIKLSKKDYIEILKVLGRNIVCTPLKKYPNGSLDYLSLPESDTFNRVISPSQAESALNKILQEKLLDQLEI